MSKIARIDYTASFLKLLKKSPNKVRTEFKARLLLFVADQFNPQLRNHQLAGKLKEYRSINVTGDWRAIFTEVLTKKGAIIVFEMIGTHSQLYR